MLLTFLDLNIILFVNNNLQHHFIADDFTRSTNFFFYGLAHTFGLWMTIECYNNIII